MISKDLLPIDPPKEFDPWFHWDLKEHKYQLSVYQRLLVTEQKLNGEHIDYFKEMIRRIQEDINYIESDPD